MHKLTFYRQARRDGAVHTGISIGDLTELDLEENETDDPDPVLAWWVDLRVEARKLPIKPEEVRQWFLERGDLITDAFQLIAEEVQAGIDFSSWKPLVWPIPNAPRGVRMTIVVHASRRTDALTIANHVQHIADHWREWVETMPVLALV